MDIAEYGKYLWDALFNQPPAIAFCPDCRHKLQWIPVDDPKSTKYWGCMKCKLKGRVD